MGTSVRLKTVRDQLLLSYTEKLIHADNSYALIKYKYLKEFSSLLET